jgi:hypothetical protein
MVKLFLSVLISIVSCIPIKLYTNSEGVESIIYKEGELHKMFNQSSYVD